MSDALDKANADKAKAVDKAEDKAEEVKEHKITAAKKKIEDKQVALTKANETAVKAHDELIQAQRELAALG